MNKTKIEWCDRKKVLTKQGYVLIWKPNHPNANKGKKNGYMFEHRFVMSEYLQRPLKSFEHIHHINGNKSDNRIENLQLFTNSEHRKLHMAELSEIDRKNLAKGLIAYSQSIKIKRQMVTCICGCGKEFETPDKKGRFHKYLHGHNQVGKTWNWRTL